MTRALLLLFLFVSTTVGQQSSAISNENERQVHDVIIVGAGLSGLAAARRITQQRPTANVLLLEARGQVGGRVRTRSMTTANGDEWVDLGSQFISRDHSAMRELAQQLGVNLVQQTTCGDRTVLIEGVRRRRRQVSWGSNLSVRPTFTELSSGNNSLASQSVGQFITSTQQSDVDAAALNRLLQTLYDAPENTVSAIQVALTAASEDATVAELLLNTGHGQSLLAEGGLFRLTQQMADGLDVMYQQKVVSIDQSTSPVTIRTPSQVFRAQQVIVTTPPAVAANLMSFNPPLDQDFKNLLDSYRPTGTAYYFTMTYPTAFWRNQNKNGEIIYTSATGKVAWLTTFDMTTSSHCVSSQGTTGVLWGIAHLTTEIVNETERCELYIQVVSKSLATQLQPVDVKDVNFSSDELAMGSIGVLKPGIDTGLLRFLSGSHTEGNFVHFASAELSNVSLGLMNGALLSGSQTADIVLSQITASGNDIQFDQPLRDSAVLLASGAVQNDFQYNTSTHYPPTTPMAVVTTQKMNSSFPYSTSTHYPITDVEPSSTEVPVQAIVVNRDEAVEEHPQEQLIQQNDSASFHYETSSHYPPTQSPISTTTYVHFSMGNLPSSGPSEGVDEAELLIRNQTAPEVPIQGSNQTTVDDVINQNNTLDTSSPAAFVYKTSSHYPPTSPLPLTTRVHFSFGNVEPDEDPANLILDADDDVDKLSTDMMETSSFTYETSSHYPPTQQPPTTTTYSHFSMGNQPSHNDAAVVVSRDPQLAVPSTGNSASQPTGTAVSPSGSAVVPVSSDISPEILRELTEVVEQAPSSSALSLATRLSTVVQSLLQSIQNTLRR